MILNGILAEGVCVARFCQSCVDRQISWGERTERCCYTDFKKVLCVFCNERFFWGVPYGKRKIFLFTYDYRHMRISLHYKLWGCVGGGLKSVSFLTFVFYNCFMGFVSKSMHFLMLNKQLCHCPFCKVEDNRSHGCICGAQFQEGTARQCGPVKGVFERGTYTTWQSELCRSVSEENERNRDYCTPW